MHYVGIYAEQEVISVLLRESVANWQTNSLNNNQLPHQDQKNDG